MGKPPRISIIMALRNEEEHLPALLEALVRQSLPAEDWEIVAAIAPSGDRTRALLEDKVALGQLRQLRIVENPERHAATGLNRALALTQARWVARLDGHSEPAPDYLERVLTRLEEGTWTCVGGPQRTIGRGPWGCAYARAVATHAGHGGARYRAVASRETPGLEGDSVDTVYLGAWPRASLISAGGFDGGLARNQDDELAMRLRERGGRIFLDREIEVLYRPRESLGAILRQYFAYGFWKPRVLRRHPARTRPRHLLPVLVFLWLAGALGLCLATLFEGALLMLAVWLLPVFLLLVPGLRSAGPAETFRTLAVAALMTPAYGLGFILGAPVAILSKPRTSVFVKAVA